MRDRSRSIDKKQNKNEHYKIKPDEIFNQRYFPKEIIQDGTFGRVLRVFDMNSYSYKAIKIIKPNRRHVYNAKIEYEILNQIQSQDSCHPGQQKIIHVEESFDHRNSYCLVFEDLGLSLSDWMKVDKRQFSIKAIQKILSDCLQGIDFMHEIGYTHTDLKPHNILLQSHSSVIEEYSIKIIDLGAATKDDEPHDTIINTRSYRAPEVILGKQWFKNSDIWSLGCTAIELFTGKIFFQTGNDDYIHLALIEKACGPLPLNMIQNSCIESYFNDYQLNDSFLKFPSTSYELDKINNMSTIQAVVKNMELLDLIKLMLQVDPKIRINAKQALSHDFFRNKY